ncbi:MAG: hypothetical protein AAF383_12455 [Cyanobacteria bacterium P01_A01_bin.83]
MDSEQTRQLAQDESTTPEKLRELADSSDSITRQNVVMNPNVPPDVLIKLAKQFPRQVFNNPAIDLLLLETPNLFSGTSADALCSLLKREVPERMIEYAIYFTDERLKLAIVMNPQTSLKILKQLAKSNNYRIAESAALHINFTNNNSADNYREFVRSKIQKETLNSDKTFREILGDIDQIIKLYEYLPRSISFYQKSKIRQKKNYPQVTLSEVERLMEKNKSVLDIASNPNISVEIINKLLEHYDTHQIGWRLALNPSTPVTVLEKLARSNYHNGVHEKIALNENTPVYILEIIINSSRHMSNYVYTALGRNKKLSDRHFRQFVNKSLDAQIAVFNNPNTSRYLKGKLLEFFKSEVYSYPYKQLANGSPIFPISKERPQEFINNLYVPDDFIELCVVIAIIRYKCYYNRKNTKPLSTLQILAAHPNINLNSLRKLAEHKDEAVRRTVLFNYKISQYITKVWGMSFLNTLNQNELKILASSFYATDKLLKELVNHKDITISRTAASNPAVTNEILEEWQTSPDYKEGVLEQIMAEEQKLLDIWESSISSANRLTVLLNSEAPIEVLAKISRSASWLERYAITQNPKTPYPVVQRLAEDSNIIVRTAAKVSLEKYQKKIIN